jgi:2-C-methyl-D-erythritol 2,4-cyclodiphosphate synthase
LRVGLGYDVHRLADGRKLILGGIEMPFEKGLIGHSDADVLIHAICDALLGAAGLDDIGVHFPDSDPTYKNISSMHILKKTAQMVLDKGFSVINIDAVIFAEAPKMSPYRQAMKTNIATALKLDPGRVNIKATTTEGLGMFGRGEGIGAMCVVLIQ